MKVVVVNAYVRENAGDAALLAVCLRHIREAFPDAQIQLVGMEDAAIRPTFDGVKNLGSIRRYALDAAPSTSRRVLRKAVSILAAVLALMLPRLLLPVVRPAFPPEVRREVDALGSADLLVSMGGGYFYARPGLDGYQHIFFVVLPALLALRRGVPVVFAPQSFGPFSTRAQRRLAAWVVRRAALALAREDISVEILAQCGVRGAPVRRGVDSGFAFVRPPTDSWRTRLGIDSGTPVVGVTARQCLAPEAQRAYERALAATIDSVQANGAMAVLIPQVSADHLEDDDRVVERRIEAYCATAPLRVQERVDFRHLKDLYSACDFMLGTRFHSVIFALTSGVPCIAIEYEHKTRGIMRDLGLEDWVLPASEVTHQRLSTLVERLQAGRQGYLERLTERLPGYVARAEEFPELLRAVMYGRRLPSGAPAEGTL